MSANNNDYMIDKVQLQRTMRERLNIGDLKQVFFVVSVDFHGVGGESIGDKCRELIMHLYRRGKLKELIDCLKIERPDIDLSNICIFEIESNDSHSGLQVEAPVLHEYEDEDLGLLDFLEVFEDELRIVVSASMRSTKATFGISEKMKQRTAELKVLKTNNDQNKRNSAKKVFRGSAIDLSLYANVMDKELMVFKPHMVRCLNAFYGQIVIMSEISAGRSNIKGKLDELNDFIETTYETEQSFLRFQESVKQIPRMLKDLNQAKNKVSAILEEWILEFRSSQLRASDVRSNFESLAR